MPKQKIKTSELPRVFDITESQTKDFFDTSYVGFCMYVLENRALPSIIDGLKPGARKVIHAGFNMLSETKKSGLIDLVGSTLRYSKYHHGNISLEGTIYTLGVDYMDNLAPLELIGSKGSLKSQEAAAPRYLSVRLSKYSRLFKQNEAILEYNYEGDYRVEPKYYLPIIPLILTSRTTGVGVGFKYGNYTSYNPISLIDESLALLKKGKRSGSLLPHINDWTGSFHKNINLPDQPIYAKGIYARKGSQLIVTEFSPTETYDSFEKNIEKLIEKGRVISYTNESGKNGIRYEIKLDKIAAKYSDEVLEKTFKIGTQLMKSTFTVLDEHGKLAEFKNADDIFEYFVNFREGKYSDLKKYIINDLNNRIKESSDLAKFIDFYLKGKIKFSKDITLDQTKKTIESFDLPGNLVETKMSKLTKDEYSKIVDKITDLKKQLEYTEKTTPKQMYIDDLVKLKKELQGDFEFAQYTEA